MSLGQATGGWTESSASLRIMYGGIRNSFAAAVPDAFTQTNPPIVTGATTISTARGVLTAVRGVLSGSVAFSRPNLGDGAVGGPSVTALTLPASITQIRPLGCFINSAAGNAYENLPAQASGRLPYMSGLGTYGNGTYETQLLIATTGVVVAAGTALTYLPGMRLVASRNGYLMPSEVFSGAALTPVDNDAGGGAYNTLEGVNNASQAAATLMGILRMVPDAAQAELTYDQRI